jgi:hypothetical protein
LSVELSEFRANGMDSFLFSYRLTHTLNGT